VELGCVSFWLAVGFDEGNMAFCRDLSWSWIVNWWYCVPCLLFHLWISWELHLLHASRKEEAIAGLTPNKK
jgi:hypothetical protein